MARARRSSRKRPVRRSFKGKKRTGRKTNIRRIVKQVLNRNLETKRSNLTSTDGTQIFHNDFVSPDAALLSTTQGIADPMAAGTDSRIGDEIMLKGVSIKMMLELNERYSDVTFRILVIRSAKGDTPTRATLFTGLSGNKMLDTLNTERYTVLAQKYCKIRSPGQTSTGGELAAGEGNNRQDPTMGTVISRGTKIIKMWIPGSKFGKGGKITYENGSTQVKFFDYRVVVYAYSNYSTLQDVYYVGRINDYIKQVFFKDG